MKRYLLLVAAALVLSACGSKGISGGEFTFDMDTFLDTYEKKYDEVPSGDILISNNKLSLEFADEEETIRFLETADEVLDDDEVNETVSRLKDDGFEDNYEAESDDLVITIMGGSESYKTTIVISDD